MDEIAATARILSEALPFLQRYDDQIIVVKYGGHAMVDPKLAHQFARDMVMLKVCGLNPIVVHGGGPQINRMLDKLEVQGRLVSDWSSDHRAHNGQTIDEIVAEPGHSYWAVAFEHHQLQLARNKGEFGPPH